MEQVKDGAHETDGRRLTLRRAAALLASLIAVSALVVVLGAAYLWPLFVFPLLLAAVFFFELGSLAVTLWLGNFFILYYSFRAPGGADLVRQALLGTALFFLAGLVLGRVQRRHHAAEQTLAASTLTDRLTGLYTYGTFVDYLHNEVTKVERYGGDLALIMLDLDHFKTLNDRHGHETGNQMLRHVGATIRSLVRDADTAARYGGEEFAVLIRGDDTHGHELAERLRQAVANIEVPVRGNATASVTVSAGVTALRPRIDTESDLIARADAALYESKHRGRDRVTTATASETEYAAPVSLSA